VVGASIALAAGYGPVFLTTAGIMAAAGIAITVFVRRTTGTSAGTVRPPAA
jgi:hypothetical protein